MIKLIMSDMDGTLLDENGQLPKGFADIVRQLRERGVLFAPCSGRQYYSLLETFKGYEDEFLFFAENGTMVRYHDRELFSSTMRRSLGIQALKSTEQLPQVYEVFCGKKDAYVLRDKMTESFAAELGKYYTHSAVVDCFEDIDDEMIKASFFDAEGKAGTRIYPVLEKYRGPFQVATSSDYWVDMMNFDINKGIAIQQVQKRLRISPMECAAFGDYMNDAEMMSSVYYSFAMDNAHPEIKKLARFRTASNKEHGVLQGIQKLIDDGLCG
ncbi:MAG: Cof-type HAD-IIB family hydrolase [Selenomonas sp.]|uniref:HAD family hydrolase n=1 Tax=Selenomonas sp. TaxID=2053611 RepID=UPI0025FE925A|nr:HAD family hydrolase [Selenomonas sp.]MCR5756775.1 Cof-type HAD-IIB family hydrolase [Selenomonas sp.]